MFTWIIEHIIGAIPVWIWTFVAGGGAAAYFMSKFVPAPYSLIVKLFSVAALLFGVFMCGGAGVTAVLQKQIQEANAKIEAAEAKSAKVNTVIQERVVTQIQIVKEKTDANNQAIEAKRDSINAECKLSDDAWMLYNNATKNALAASAGRANSTGK
jgi:hypothetical protein